jgi:hypothetical protein
MPVHTDGNTEPSACALTTAFQNKKKPSRAAMSINFAFTFAPISGAELDSLFPPADLPLDPTILTALLMPTGMLGGGWGGGGGGLSPFADGPTAVSTADFPDRRRPKPRRGVQRTNLRKRGRDTMCSVCLDPLDTTDTVRLPCAHELHRRCLFALLCTPVLGCHSMMRCPLCRREVDRYDLRAVGLDAAPRRLRGVANRCAALRALSTGAVGALAASAGEAPVCVTARLIRRCRHLSAEDGFVYNCAVLALERAIHHRRLFQHTLNAQLRHAAADTDVHELIRTNLACHVEVLIKTRQGPGA